MKPTYHIIASAGISCGVQAAMHSWPATIGCFFSGVLIDLDHYLEYGLVRKKFPFRYQDLVDFCWDGTVTKMYLFFHSYELMCMLWLLVYYFHLGGIWIGIALGLTTHMIFDQFTNPTKPLFYFMMYRIKHGFEKSQTMTENYYQKPNK